MTYCLIACRISEDTDCHRIDVYDLEEGGHSQLDASAPCVVAELQIDNLAATGRERANLALQRQAHRYGPAQMPTPRNVPTANAVLRQAMAILQRVCHARPPEDDDEDALEFGTVIGEELIGAEPDPPEDVGRSWSRPRTWSEVEVGQAARIVDSDLVGHIHQVEHHANGRIAIISYSFDDEEHTEQASRLADFEICSGG